MDTAAQQKVAADMMDTAEYRLGDLVGVGGFGRVHRAEHVPTGAMHAVKILARRADVDNAALAREVELLRSCDSAHIVAYFGALEHSDGSLWISMECCEGSVLDVMEATRACLTERQISAVLAAALDGLLFLHRRQIMHRDVKAANILLTSTGQVKLADFGVATRLSSSLSAKHTLVGTAPWLAPEVAVGRSDQLARRAGLPVGVGYGKKADVWSLAITAIELARLS